MKLKKKSSKIFWKNFVWSFFVSSTIKGIKQLDTGAIDHSSWLTIERYFYYHSIDWFTHTYAMCNCAYICMCNFALCRAQWWLEAPVFTCCMGTYERLHSDTSARSPLSMSWDILPWLPTAVYHSLLHSLLFWLLIAVHDGAWIGKFYHWHR